MDITIIGGHGKIALLLEPLLVEAGHTVRAVIRDAAQREDVEATGAIAEVVDIEALDAAGWTALLDGADGVVWSAGAGGGDAERTYRVDRDAAILAIDAAHAAGVRHYVQVSYFGAGPDHGVPEDDSFFAYADAKTAADEHLIASGLDGTILRPSALTLEEPTGRIDVDADNAGQVSRANVALVIAAVLEREDLEGAIIEFNDGRTPIDAALDEVAGN